VEAEFAHEFIRSRGRFAYEPIVGAGKNACILHYLENCAPLKNGQLLLMDVGAAYANYNSDMTRTIPVNGKFTKRQRAVYDAVFRVLEASTEAASSGTQAARLAKAGGSIDDRRASEARACSSRVM
jgi:Xaa-Pro aminopeptidase